HKEEFRFVKYLMDVGINVRPYSESLWWSDATDEYKTVDWDADLSGGTGAFSDVTNDPLHVARAEERGVKLRQWRILDCNGHFGGSLDGIADASFDVTTNTVDSDAPPKLGATPRIERTIPAGEEFLLEFKTHNTKSFVNLVNIGVREAKPEHWSQMQVYMHKRGLKHALYMAVNK